MKMRDLVNGAVAGAAGTAALNAGTYIDMALRNRPPSEMPAKMVDRLAREAGIAPLAENRRTGLGALLGYADGFGAGVVFGAVRPRMRGVPWLIAGIGLGAVTMLLSEGAATAMGETDPRTWGTASWIADIVPRCVYGWVTCLAFDRLTES